MAAIPRADGPGSCPPTCPATCRTRPARRPAAGSTRAARSPARTAAVTRPAPGHGGRPPGRLPRPGPAARRPRHPRGTGSHAVMWLVNAHVVDVLTGDGCPAAPSRSAPTAPSPQVTASAPPGLPDARGDRRRGPLAAARADLLPHPPVGGVPVLRHRRGGGPGASPPTGPPPGPAAPCRPGSPRSAACTSRTAPTCCCATAARRGWISAPRILGAGRAISTAAATARASGLRLRHRRGGVLPRPRWPSSRPAPTT